MKAIREHTTDAPPDRVQRPRQTNTQPLHPARQCCSITSLNQDVDVIRLDGIVNQAHAKSLTPIRKGRTNSTIGSCTTYRRQTACDAHSHMQGMVPRLMWASLVRTATLAGVVESCLATGTDPRTAPVHKAERALCFSSCVHRSCSQFALAMMLHLRVQHAFVACFAVFFRQAANYRDDVCATTMHYLIARIPNRAWMAVHALLASLVTVQSIACARVSRIRSRSPDPLD